MIYIASPVITAHAIKTQNTTSHTPNCRETKELRLHLRSIPRVSAEAESVSAIRITRRASGTMKISIYSGKQNILFAVLEKAPRVWIDWDISFISLEITGKNRKITEMIMIRLSGM